MNTGFYNAAIQMSTGNVLQLEVHTENLANCSLPGYKRLETNAQAFSEMMEQAGASQASSPIRTNYQQGALRVTDRPLDFAIEGEGFFVVSDGEQDFYTRNGGFRLAEDGSVVNSLGMKVQTSTGDLNIPQGLNPADLVIDDKLNISIGKRMLGQIKITAFEEPTQLEQAGSTLFTNPGLDEKDADCTVMNGVLEQSNTAIFEEMVGIMTTLRNYEACQKMLRSVDEADSKMMEKLV